MVKEYPQHGWGFQKALAMPSPAAAACLPLMRADFPVSGENVCKADKRGLEVDSPQAKTEGEKQEEEIFSPPVFCFAKASPLVRGGLRCVNNRICGSRSEHARNLDEPIGSVSKRP